MNDAEKLRQVQEWANGEWRSREPFNEYHRGFHHAAQILQDILSKEQLDKPAPDTEPERPRPPLGVKPRWLHEAQRVVELSDAVKRYASVTNQSPDWTQVAEWAEEIADITTRLSERYGRDTR